MPKTKYTSEKGLPDDIRKPRYLSEKQKKFLEYLAVGADETKAYRMAYSSINKRDAEIRRKAKLLLQKDYIKLHGKIIYEELQQNKSKFERIKAHYELFAEDKGPVDVRDAVLAEKRAKRENDHAQAIGAAFPEQDPNYLPLDELTNEESMIREAHKLYTNALTAKDHSVALQALRLKAQLAGKHIERSEGGRDGDFNVDNMEHMPEQRLEELLNGNLKIVEVLTGTKHNLQ